MREKLSANLGFLWPELHLMERFSAAAAAGFMAVELHWPYEVPAEQVRSVCARLGLKLLGINTPVGSRDGDFGLAAVPGREEEFKAAFVQSLDYVVTAGGSSIHVMAGNLSGADRQSALETFRDNLRWAEPLALEKSIDLLIEPINSVDKPDYAIHSIEDGLCVLQGLDGTGVRIMFDCYHVGRETGGVERRLREALDKVGHIQIAAVPSRAEPDEGELDYRTIMQTIQTIGYKGFVGCEYRPRSNTDAGLAWRNSIL
jgi:hydroxypyruvate isomerase